jgi:hypothetical protein
MLNSVATVECIVTASPLQHSSNTGPVLPENPLVQAAYKNHEELLEHNSDPRQEVVLCEICGINFLRDKRARKQRAFCPLVCSPARKKELGKERVGQHRKRKRLHQEEKSPGQKCKEQQKNVDVTQALEKIIASPTSRELLAWLAQASQYDLSEKTCDKLQDLPKLSLDERSHLLVSLKPWQIYAHKLSGAVGFNAVHCEVIQDAILIGVVKRNINSAYHGNDRVEGFNAFHGRKLKCRPPPRS